eukprot:1860573-Prymnesium_polylepis.1
MRAVWLLAVVRLHSAAADAADDYAALLALYNATNGMGWARNTNWLKGDDACANAWHGVLCGPKYHTFDCDAGQNTACDACLKAIAYPTSECPSDAVMQVMPNCVDASYGDLCEADGECGTNDGLDNCRGYDIYRKAALPANYTNRHVKRLRLTAHSL